MYFDINTHKECFKTNKDEAYFWHGRTNGCGGQDVAMDIAAENNGKTLEMCMLEHRDELEQSGVEFFDRPDGTVEIFYGSNQDENNKFWEDCSKFFAEQSSGSVHVIEGSDLRPNGQSEIDYPSVYNRIEHPALEKNPQVGGITKIDPQSRNITGRETFDEHNKSRNIGNKLNSKKDNSIVCENGGGARAPNAVRGNTNNPENHTVKKGERGQLPPQDSTPGNIGSTQNQKGRLPDANNDTTISSNYQSKITDEAAKKAAEQSAQNTVTKTTGMGV